MLQPCEMISLCSCSPNGDLLGWLIVQESPPNPNRRDELLKDREFRFNLMSIPFQYGARVKLRHETVALVGKCLPDLFRDERHKRMQESLHGFKGLHEGLSSPFGFR